MRFADSPFSNPFASSERVSREPESTASTQMAPVYTPTAPIQSQALPPIQAQPVQAASTYQERQPLQAVPQATPMATAPATVSSGNPGWSGNGAAARVSTAPAAAPRSAAPVQVSSAPASQPAAAGTKFRFVQGAKSAGEASQPVAMTEPKAHPRPGMTSAPMAAAQPAKASPAPVQVASASPEPIANPAKAVDPQKMAVRVDPQPAKPAAVQAQPAPVAAAPAQPQESAKSADAAAPAPADADASDEFRWPARGRIIAGFGANGGNEGINIAVPEGTPVKAAEDGVVTYAGSEVKGYGNLVLIRHENGYVSAYANNGALSVKRGESVKRGQVIATSGQTGNVTSPQLHFELRKGSTPVDPVPHLGG